jgi:hypothetical protein
VSHRGSSSSAMTLASQPHRRSPVENLSRHYAGMMQDGLRIAGPLGGGGGVPPTPHTHPHPNPNLSDWPVG